MMSKPGLLGLTAFGRSNRFRLFFTPAGGAILVFALAILIRSLLARNSYEILLACAALLFLLVVGVTGAWKASKLKLLEPGWKPPFPMTANAGQQTPVTGLGAHIPLFFRLHYIISGRFYPAGNTQNNILGNDGCFVLVETSVPRKEETAYLQLDFPMSGVFLGDGFCRLRDIFGFYSFSCGIPQHRTVNVRSAPCIGRNYYINAQSGAEDRRNKHSNDEERYYMREYTPGDRLRDINWKSSEKIDALITRISPDNQEKVSRITVYLRNFGPKKPSLQALWLLDRSKAQLSGFLRSLKEQQSSFIFDVYTARSRTEIEDEEDLDAFLEELAGLRFSPPVNETDSPILQASQNTSQKAGDIYVFSTACDLGLSGFLLACSNRPVSLFLVQPKTEPKTSPGAQITETDIQTLYKRDFPAKGCLPRVRWLFERKLKPVSVHVDRAEMIYAETRL